MASLHGNNPHRKIKTDLISVLLGRKRLAFPLSTKPVFVKELDIPKVLSFSLANNNLVPAVSEGEDVKVGQPLALLGEVPYRPSPVSGKVKRIVDVPDVLGGQPVKAILIEPDPNTSAQVFPPLDLARVSLDEIQKRLRETGVDIDGGQVELSDEKPRSGPVLVSAVDQEPGVSILASLLKERKADIERALLLIGKLYNTDQVMLVVAGPTEIDPHKVKVLKIPKVYPESLPALLIRRIGDPSARVFSLEYALAALDAVLQGRVRDQKTISLIDNAGAASENIRVRLGTRFADIAEQCRLDIRNGNKILAGGPMRGVAQYSTDVAVDETIDAITVVQADDLTPFSNDPCINCGACIDVCPLRLQVQMIGRYSEFGKFDDAKALDVEHCIECGLCASVCTACRALVQLIKLAKSRLTEAEKNPA